MDKAFLEFACDVPVVLYQLAATTDGHYNFEFISPRSREIFGLEPDPKRFFTEFNARVPPEELGPILESVAEVVRTRSTFRREGSFLRDGVDGAPPEKLWWRAISSPRVREDGSLVFSGVLFDITEEHQAKERVALSEARYRQLFEHMPSGFSLNEIILDEAGTMTDYRFMELNPAFERLTGAPVSQLLGKTLRETMPNTEAYWIEVFGKVALTGIPTSYENFSRELGRWYDTYVFCPQHGRFAVLFNDVTSRKAIEHELRDREALLSGMAANSPGALFKLRVDANGPPQLLYASEDAFGKLGIADGLPEDFGGILAYVATLLHPDDRPTLAGLVDHAQLRAQAAASGMPSQRAQQLRLAALTAAGTERWFQIHAQVDWEGEGFVLYAHVLDITPQKNAERLMWDAAVARESNEAKTRFLSRMSHELRTPLNAVLGYAQLLQMDTAHPLAPEQKRKLDIIQRSGDLLLTLIDDVLNLSHIEEGGFSMSIEPVELFAEIAVAVDQVRPMADRMGISLIVEPPEHPCRILADRTRLGQVYANLLTNAIKYNRPNGSVHISIATSPDSSMLGAKVRDTGLGMSAQQLGQLFVPFNRLGREQSTIEGSGIGLTIVERLLKLMHGRIEVQSSSNVGTTFTVLLPPAGAVLAPQPPFAVEIQGPGWAPAPDGPSALRVLYVEDNEVNCLLIQEGLSMTSRVQLRVATSGEAALAAMQEEPPDMLLMDMHMGDMTARELIAKMEALSSLGAIPRMLLTADAFLLASNEVRRMGFLACLQKPVKLVELAKAIDQFFPGTLRMHQV